MIICLSAPPNEPDRPGDPLRGRAGLVGTQNIRNNQSRVGGLDHVVKDGVIVEAVDNQPWSGEANVHVSIANWVKKRPPPVRLPGSEQEDEAAYEATLLISAKRKLWQKVEASSPLFESPPVKRGRRATTVTGSGGKVRKNKSFELAARDTPLINSALSDQVSVGEARNLACNAEPKRVFQGVTPGHDGFVLSEPERLEIIHGDPASKEVIHEYLSGRELVLGDGSPDRHIIDFQRRSLVEAQQYSGAFSRVKKLVMPDRIAKAQQGQGRWGSSQTAP